MEDLVVVEDSEEATMCYVAVVLEDITCTDDSHMYVLPSSSFI